MITLLVTDLQTYGQGMQLTLHGTVMLMTSIAGYSADFGADNQ